MNPEEYQVMRSQEDCHWWYRGLRAMLARRISSVVEGQVSTLLDAGCGTGANLRFFRQLFPDARLTGLDLSPLALENAGNDAQLSHRLGDVNRMDFAVGTFDLVFSGNVLSHQNACPPLAVAEFFRVLRPGGVLLLNLPALEGLRGGHDEAVHETRRFDAAQVHGLLVAAGFAEVECRYWNFLLVPVLWLRRRWTRRRGGNSSPARSDLEASGGWLNTPLGLWMEAETRLAAALPLPFGSSLFATARKPLSSKNLPHNA